MEKIPGLPEKNKKSNPLGEKIRKGLKVLGVSSVLFSSSQNSEAQTKKPIQTSDKQKVNLYLDSLDAYNTYSKHFFEERERELKRITTENQGKKSDELTRFEDNITPTESPGNYVGKRSGKKIPYAYRAEYFEKDNNGLSSSVAENVYKIPDQPYVYVPAHKKDKIKKIEPHSLLEQKTEIEFSRPEEVAPPSFPEFSVSSEHFPLEIQTFDKTLKHPNASKIMSFENEQERQNWIKANVSHLQRIGPATFLDTDTIPDNNK